MRAHHGQLPRARPASSQELHDRATRHAADHVDVKYFRRLLQPIPAAETVEHQGDISKAYDDVEHPSYLLHDAAASDPGLIDALRSLYLVYLSTHPDA